MTIQPKKYVQELNAYVPGQSLGENYTKLSSNENPLGPSAKAIARAGSAIRTANRYPNDHALELKTKLSDYLSVPKDWIVLGVGSDEVLAMALHSHLGIHDSVVISSATFPMYQIFAKGCGASIVEVPILPDGVVDINQMAKAAPANSVVCVANPNNPTGTTIDINDFIASAQSRRDVLFVYDAAYEEYRPSSQTITSTDLDRNRNIVVSRTFSKAFGLAGFRIGYLYGHPDTVQNIAKLRPPFNVSSIAIEAACGALDDQEHLAKTIATNRRWLDQYIAMCETFKLTYFPSEANFLFLQLPRKQHLVSGQDWANQLLEHRIIVRALPNIGFDNWIRVNTGTDQESQLFIDTMSGLLAA